MIPFSYVYGVDTEEFLALWEEKLQTPEGRSACLYSFGLTVGEILVQIEDPGVDPASLVPTKDHLTKLWSAFQEAGVDTSIVDDLWACLQEATPKFQTSVGTSAWDLLLGE